MKKRLTNIAKILRRNSTSQETKLWAELSAKRFYNFKFRRQFPIGKYIVDFCCPNKRLIIELDGGGHLLPKQKELDEIRDTYFKNRGFKILRVWNNEVDENLEGVMEEIYYTLNE